MRRISPNLYMPEILNPVIILNCKLCAEVRTDAAAAGAVLGAVAKACPIPETLYYTPCLNPQAGRWQLVLCLMASMEASTPGEERTRSVFFS